MIWTNARIPTSSVQQQARILAITEAPRNRILRTAPPHTATTLTPPTQYIGGKRGRSWGDKICFQFLCVCAHMWLFVHYWSSAAVCGWLFSPLRGIFTELCLKFFLQAIAFTPIYTNTLKYSCKFGIYTWRIECASKHHFRAVLPDVLRDVALQYPLLVVLLLDYDVW